MTILALDLGSKTTGWATPEASGTWDMRIKRDESAGMRLIRLKSKLVEFLPLRLVVFERPASRPGRLGALTVQAELQGVVKLFCEEHGIDYREYSPGEIKRHATGKGNASKEEMVEAAEERWPMLRVEDDNHADALWLLDLASSEYGEVL